jgi:hypothetical protein
MPKIDNQLLQNFLSDWPNIFEDLQISSVPVTYLESMQLEFADGRIWEFDIKEQLLLHDDVNVSNNLTETFQEYHTEIVKLNFKINVEKIKSSIEDQTKKLL